MMHNNLIINFSREEEKEIIINVYAAWFSLNWLEPIYYYFVCAVHGAVSEIYLLDIESLSHRNVRCVKVMLLGWIGIKSSCWWIRSVNINWILRKKDFLLLMLLHSVWKFLFYYWLYPSANQMDLIESYKWQLKI